MNEIKFTDILKDNKLSLAKYKDAKVYKVKVLTNITCNQLAETLKYNLYEAGICCSVDFGDYDNIIQDSATCEGYDLVIIHYDLITVLDKKSKFIEDFSDVEMKSFCELINNDIDFILANLKSISLVLFNSFNNNAIYCNSLISSRISNLVSNLNAHLAAINNSNMHVVNTSEIINNVGLNSAIDLKLFTLSKTLYTFKFWMEYSNAIRPIICKVNGKLKKAVIFDCDNTLWKGILGEDGEDGIDMSISSKIGFYYNKIQQIAVWLSHQGVIVGLCSKNNPDDVKHAIDNHKDMYLHYEDIAISKVNWQDKASNLKAIAKELNIGIDSIIFVDDSPFEINLIREQVPDVLTFQVPSNIIEYPSQFIRLINRWFYLDGNKADAAKTLQYKQQTQREEAKAGFSSMESYLKSLQLNITIDKNDFGSIARIAQLTQKTNQFNVTTRRYTEQQIKEFFEDPSYSVLSVSVTDKFGDSGLTGVVILAEKEGRAVIDSFIMSCRIMGRNIEKAIMNYIIDFLSMRGVNELIAEYIPTKKNLPVATLFDDVGFNVYTAENGNKKYILKLREYKVQDVGYIKTNYNE
jgi:FkbH-like protein